MEGIMTRLVYWCVLLLVAAVGIGSCRCNPKYCEGALDDNCDNLTDVAQRCTSNEQCEAPTAVCDVTGSMTCVQCTPDQASACSGTTPACGEDQMCRACRAHAECPGSDTCLPDGSCADPGQVAYVEPAPNGSDNDQCTRTTPCTVIAKAVATGRAYVKLKGTTDEQVTLNNRNVTLLADPGAKLTSTSNGILLRIDGTSQVAIYDLEISGASGAGVGFGISIPAGATGTVTLTRVKVSGNQAGGISASGGRLTVSQSTISGNTGGGISASSGMLTVSQSTISGNTGGGISASSGMLTVSQSTISVNNEGGISVTGAGTTFDITNCFIFRNGNRTTANVGGVNLGALGGGSVFAFNTVIDNESRNTAAATGGVFCDIPEFIASNNIIARNFVDTVPNQSNSNTFGQCGHSTSKIASTVSGLNFVSPDVAPHDYHIQQGSSAIDQATTPSTLAVDIDGDPRPQGNARDQGADEVP
jgi:hypothetical protein